jgi:predicted nucleic acid-binding Zn ribbon protein
LEVSKLDRNEFEVYKASAHKCPRCWKYTATKEETLCSRCEEVLNRNKMFQEEVTLTFIFETIAVILVVVLLEYIL